MNKIILKSIIHILFDVMVFVELHDKQVHFLVTGWILISLTISLLFMINGEIENANYTNEE